MGAALTTQILKAIVSKGSLIAPDFAGSLAFRLFNRPQSAQMSCDRERDMARSGAAKLAQATKFCVSSGKADVQAYYFPARRHKGTVILVHGWTSQASHLMALVAPLVDRGFSVVCFDLPAHGQSSGSTTNIVECARALQRIASLFPAVHGIVAHSFGGPVTALALAGFPSGTESFDVNKIALIASPNESGYIMRAFGDAIGLESQAQSGFEAQFETLCHCPLAEFTGTQYFTRIDRPMLVLHGDRDCEIPHAHGVRYGALAQCDFVSLKNLGHRDILYAPEVSRRIGQFMAA